MEREDLEPHVWNSIDCLLENDSYLLEEDLHEQSISHKLAEYIQQELPEWDVDCEYNKDLDEVKSLEDYDKDSVRPDIVVHTRGTNENILVIEIKLTTSDEDDDENKVQKYVNSPELDYQHGFFLLLEAGDRAGVEEFEWFA